MSASTNGTNLPRRQRNPRPEKARCRCGLCAVCVDNARWERIYQEKFADPFYYVQGPIRYASPLYSLAS